MSGTSIPRVHIVGMEHGFRWGDHGHSVAVWTGGGPPIRGAPRVLTSPCTHWDENPSALVTTSLTVGELIPSSASVDTRSVVSATCTCGFGRVTEPAAGNLSGLGECKRAVPGAYECCKGYRLAVGT